MEAPGQMGVGRFGWKDQHASLLSFSADAYLNEMGITNRLQPDEVTKLCNTVSEPNDTPGPDGLSDIDHFARFIRATKAPARDTLASEHRVVEAGLGVFEKIGCATCHTETMTTAPAGTRINGGTFTIPAALGSVTFHPYGDFLMHDVGTGDGILQAIPEHYGKKVFRHDVRLYVEAGLREQPEQDPHRAFVGSAPTSALDARWCFADLSRRHFAARWRSKTRNHAI